MTRQVDSFEDYDIIIDYYKSALNHWSKSGNKKYNGNNWTNSISITDNLPLLIFMNEISSTIVKSDNFIKELIKTSPSKETYISNMLRETNINRSIRRKKEMSDIEFHHQIRNAIAHHNYQSYIDIKSHKNDYIVIENEFIKGKIKVTELYDYACGLEAIGKEMDKEDDLIANFDNLFRKELKNEYDLDKALLDLKLVSIKGIDNSKAVTYLVPNLDVKRFFSKIVPLKKEERNLIKNYINYYGPNRLKLDNAEKYRMLSYLHFYANKNKVASQINFGTITLKTLLGEIDQNTSILAPFIFNYEVMQYSYFCLNLIKETAKNDNLEKEIFENTDFSDINIKEYRDDVQEPITNNRKNQLRRLIEQKQEKIERNQEQVNKIIINTKMTNEKKEELLNQKREQLINDAREKEKLEEELNLLNKPNYYLNTIDFYNKLRNSISHDNISIDYNSGLKNFDLYNTKITFRDENVNGKVFKFTLTVRELLKMYDKIIKSIKQNAHFYQDEQIIRVGSLANKSKLVSDTEARENFENKFKELLEDTKHQSGYAEYSDNKRR